MLIKQPDVKFACFYCFIVFLKEFLCVFVHLFHLYLSTDHLHDLCVFKNWSFNGEK